MAFYEKHLKEGEYLISVIRPFWLSYFIKVIIGFLFVLTAFFFAIPLFQWGNYGLVVFWLILLIGLLIVFRLALINYQRTFIITNKRVIYCNQKGVFEKLVSEAPLTKIQNVSYQVKGIWRTLFNFGTLIIQTSGDSERLQIDRIKDPHYVQSLIIDLQELSQTNNFSENLTDQKNKNLSPKAWLRLIDKIKKEKRTEFEKLISQFPKKNKYEQE